ncbi:MAG: protein translocase subunit SecD [Oceanicaulis sp.]|uniref:protein translocase subunit SecD n=1 Tax=Glycocaulis sp. TaxID=1969725 RepID=UPI0025B98D33|nr:protein translocase subunit SecD [Glycocaulis sp.]MCC5980216.1 protein translocase subunit SecD [Oceanicaulis sp.]MCH8521295.1 protein translocase subunit SecD [Glycocaulis sp.]
MLYFARWKIALILGTILLGVLFLLPNFVAEDQRFDAQGRPQGAWEYLPSNSVNLGLDLRGGSHLVFQVDMDEVRAERIVQLADDVRTVLRNQPAILTAAPAVVEDRVVVRLSRPEDMTEAMRRLQSINEPISTQMGQPGLDRTLSIQQDPDGRTIRVSITEAAFESIQRRTVTQSVEVIRRRIDATGTTEPTIVRQGDDRVLVQVPGESDPQRIIDIVGTTARMTFHMVEANVDPGPDGQGRMPPGIMAVPTEYPEEPFLAVQRRALVTGEQLVNASQGFNEAGQPAVTFRFNTSGARAFGEATAANVGRRFAIVLDDVIISAPRIRSPIMGGSGLIDGGFTVQSATDLANMLNAGALPARLTPVEQRTVSAGLGQDSIERGQTAIIIGFSLVIVFMLLAYGFFGVASTMALIINICLLLGGLSGLQATLTLPGIAGIVLTIGMAVDANVLIFERIREEYRSGRTVANAIENGYQHALSAILDANVTTFIAAAVLYMMGAGPVRGFAVTLGIGIITSVFTAFVFSRLLLAGWLRFTKPKALPM